VCLPRAENSDAKVHKNPETPKEMKKKKEAINFVSPI
jgi:hypothetical protein